LDVQDGVIFGNQATGINLSELNCMLSLTQLSDKEFVSQKPKHWQLDDFDDASLLPGL
jgi:hypothetical protein